MSTEKIILDNIKYRRSVFPVSYIDQDIPDEIIKELLTYANYAPSHKLTQPWFFTVFKGQGGSKRLLIRWPNYIECKRKKSSF